MLRYASQGPTTGSHDREAGERTPTDPPRFQPALAALAETIRVLDAEGIRFCSWKSNRHLDAGLSGRTDVDLLVDAEQATAFRRILRRSCLLQLVQPADRRVPGIEHYLGFDPASGRLFHLHVHLHVIVGSRGRKDRRIPVESAFLGTTERLHGVPVPAPAVELAVLTIRGALKYRPRDVVKDTLGIRSFGIDGQILTEIEWLLGRTTIDEACRVVREAGNLVPPDALETFLTLAKTGRRDGLAALRVRRRVSRALPRLPVGPAPSPRTGIGGALARAPRRMTPARGGRTIALVGADGAGKTTHAAEITRWLAWKIDARLCYLGSKTSGPLAGATYATFRGFRRLHRTSSERRWPSSVVDPAAWLRDVALACHHLATGYGRSRRYERAVRVARAGGVVILDRFPLASLDGSPAARLMDGPKIEATLGPRRGLVRWLASREEQIYRRFRPPDELLALDVDPSVAAARKPDHDARLLDAKARAVTELVRAGTVGATVVRRIDANAPADVVLGRLKGEVWRALAPTPHDPADAPQERAGAVRSPPSP